MFFDPRSKEVPSYPFAHLPKIANRARVLLESRTVEEILKMARGLDFAIFCHRSDALDDEISRLQEILNTPRRWKREPAWIEQEYDRALEFFEWVGSMESENGEEYGGQWQLKEDARDKLMLDGPYSTDTDAEVLRILARGYAAEDVNDIANATYSELFATLALCRIAETASALKPDKQFNFGHEINMAVAGENAIEAMDAVCFAEHFRYMEDEAKIRAMREHEACMLRSENAKKLNSERHRENYEAKSIVVAEWEKDISRFSSADMAGVHIASWLLETKGIEKTPRTVAGWIREHAKKIGVRFR